MEFKEFELHANLENKIFIKDLPLSRLLLENECHYPWLMLVPRRAHVRHITDLTSPDQWQLLQEINFAHSILTELYHPIQINVAALGNKTPQLHVHIIARQLNDPAWPETVWDHPVRCAYSEVQKAELIQLLTQKFD